MNIEPLEARIAPASVSFTDVDGDKVVVTTSGTGVLTLGGNVLVAGSGVALDFTVGPAGFQGANVSIVATRNVAMGGDGFVKVGYIKADGIDLGAVLVDGDLAAISAGDATTDLGFGLKSLSVQSLGLDGTSGAESHIVGKLGALKVKGDVENVWLHVTGNGTGDEAHGTIGPVTIGGSIVGGVFLRSGSIESSGDIGAVKIGDDIRGGTGTASGFIQSDSGKIKSVTLGGSLIGDAGQFSGMIRSGSDLGPVKITGDVRGGSGPTSGFIASFTGFGPDNGTIAKITIGGSLIGGGNFESGHIHSIGAMGAVKIGDDVQGSAGNKSGYISSDAAMGSVRIGGSLIGGTGTDSGEVIANGMGAVSIRGSILGSTIDSGGSHSRTGVLESLGVMGAVKIGGDVDGGTVENSGVIHSTGRLAALTITGSFLGGTNFFSGEILADSGITGLLKIGGDVRGGTGAFSGSIFDGNIGAIAGKVGAVLIGGSLIGDDFPSVSSGRIIFASQVVPASITIKGNMDAGAILGGDIGRISIGGSMTSGFIGFSGAVGSISIGKNFGSIVEAASIYVQGHAATTDHPSIAIKSISIGGNVINSSIIAASGGAPQNPDAQIGTVKVGGDWIASDLVAGVTSIDGEFGDSNDVAVSQSGEPDAFFSRIASIVIRGSVLGGPGGADHNGFVAQQIGSFKSLGFTPPLTTGTDRDTAIPGTTTIRIVEVI